MERKTRGRGIAALATAGTLAAVVGMAACGGGLAPAQAQAATVKAASATSGSGVYKVTVKQDKVSQRAATVKLAKRSALKKAGVKKVRVKATIAYKKKVAVKKSKTVKVSKLATAKKASTAAFKFPAFGAYKVKVTYYGKSGRALKTTTLKKVGIAAANYNIAMFNGTYPVLMFSMGLFDENDITKGGKVPTYVTLSRADAYNWKGLPKAVHSLPFLKNAKAGTYGQRRAATKAYVANLRSANKNSTYDYWVTDNGIKTVFDVMYGNKIRDSKLKVHMLSDGAGSAEWFKQVYDVEGSNPYTANKAAVAEWNKAKARALAGKTPKYAKMKHIINKGVGSLCMSRYSYAAMSAQANYDWWIGYGGNFASTDQTFLDAAKAQMTMFSIASDLTVIEGRGNSAAFKKLYHLSDEMFAKAIANHKKPLVIMGTRVNREENFEPFVRFLKKYYGSGYEYYYKGHPGTPTKYHPEKAKQLKKLGVTDIDSSIAAELIVFYNPDIYVAGLSNSTLNSSYQAGHTLAYLGTRLADKDKITSGDLFQLFFTKIDSSYEQGILDLVKDDAGLSHSYLGELNDGTGDIVIYDSSKDTVTKYAKQADGSYALAAAEK